MAVFMCIYLRYRINKQRDTSFEFSSILSTIDLSKHWITTWIIWKFIQLVNFVTFIAFFFLFGNRVWLNLYERALSVNELLSHIKLRVASIYKNVPARIYSVESISAIRYWVSTIMDKSLGTNLHLWCFFTRAKQIHLHLFNPSPSYNVGHVYTLFLQSFNIVLGGGGGGNNAF